MDIQCQILFLGQRYLNASAQSKIIAMILTMASEIERELISSRQKKDIVLYN